MSNQQLLLGVGAKKKTYMDDIYSTYVYKGNSADRTITTGVDIKGQGGMIWVKKRSNPNYHIIADTARDDPSLTGQKYLATNVTDAESSDTNGIKYYYNTGFMLGGGNHVNNSSHTYSSYSFRKAPGFFDVIKYTGTGSNRTIAHSLGSKPGMIWVKRVDSADSWFVYHKALGATKKLYLNDDSAPDTTNSCWNNTEPTDSVFTVGTDGGVNGSGGTYVAYVFGGGGSTAAKTGSIDFTGANNNQYAAPPSALIPFTGKDSNQFCLETWIRLDQGGNNCIYGQYTGGNSGRMFLWFDNTTFKLFVGGSDEITVTDTQIAYGDWHHVAWSYDGTTHRLFIDGMLRGQKLGANIGNDITDTNPRIGTLNVSGYDFNGQMSNFRVVHGQAVYTDSFKPSTVPLTTTSQGVSGTNCKVLCFNQFNQLTNDGAFGNLTNPGSATLTYSTEGPFDDPAGFVIGENEDQNSIKCGAYFGTGSGANGPEIYLGWEPQWVLIKRIDATTEDWTLYDSMRGIVDGGNDMQYKPAYNYGETSSVDRFSLTSTGFRVTDTDNDINGNGVRYLYTCIRRPDGYIGKPVKLGTDVFAMDTGGDVSEIPNFDSGFPVDFAMTKQPAGAGIDWYTTARHMAGWYIYTNSDDVQQGFGNFTFDSNAGWSKNQNNSSWQSWMWKRHAGFDVVPYKGDGVAGRQIAHGLGKVPEMMWVKRRNLNSSDWWIYHKGLNGGTTPEDFAVRLNTQDQEANLATTWNDTAPTSTHFTVGSYALVNGGNDQLICMLFASVAGVCKVGYYDGSNSEQTITTGFQPRFVWIRVTSDNGPFVVLDTTRGWGSGNDNYLDMSSTAAQVSADLGAPTSTGFTLIGNDTKVNSAALNRKYMYYAHA